jgi:tRNA nucleotidyltransferase (CCA-adding enzyme)
VLTHTQHCLDALVQLPPWQKSAHKAQLTFAVLAHDFGKPATTVRAEKNGLLRWMSPGHASRSGPLAQIFLRRIGAPLEFDDHVRALVENHHAHDRANMPLSDAGVRRLALRLAPANIDELTVVMEADGRGRPPLPHQEVDERIEQLRQSAVRLAFQNDRPRPLVLGRHLIALGHRPGPAFKPLLDAAFEAQLDGAFVDESGGVAWLQRHIRQTAGDPA